MRIATLMLVVIVVTALLGACTENVGDLFTLQPLGPAGPLYGRSWYNSQESHSGDTVIFRPQGYLVPPSTPRYGPIFLDGFRFDEDGQFMLYTFGPADAPETFLGHWQAVTNDKNTLLITLDNTERQPPFRLRVLSVENDKLLVVRLP
ncbi:hypothetical protein ACW9KT_04960 [Hymenobacter sp. HD11105]